MMPELLEQVRSALLNARLQGAFFLRREGEAVRLDLRRKEAGGEIVAALKARSFGMARTDEKGVLLISAPPPDKA